MRERGPLAAALIAVIAIVVVVGVLALPREGPVATSPSPAPSPTATSSPEPPASPSLAPSPSLTASPSPSPVFGRFVNATLGFSVDLTPPWHRSECFSYRIGTGASFSAAEVFIVVRDYDAIATDTGVHHDTVEVLVVANPDGLSPREWESSGRLRMSAFGATLSDVTFAGRPALRAVAGDAEAYAFDEAGLMFQVLHSASGTGAAESTAQQRASIVSSFRLLSEAERRAAPTPTPASPRTPEQVADVLAEGFAKKDVSILATVIATGCISQGVNQGGGSSMDAQRYLDELADRFRNGLVVEVRPRPITGERTGQLPTVVIGSTWRDPLNPPLEVDLMISPEGERWYWRGNIAFGGGRP